MGNRTLLYVSSGIGAVVFLCLTTAWFQIQAMRWGYRAQDLRQQLEELEKKEQTVERRLQETLSLARLDDLAKSRFHLQIPSSSQIILISDKIF